MRKLSLTPAEGFLYSRVDSASSERDLSLITGLSEEAVARALDRLAQLGAIDFGDPPKPMVGESKPPQPSEPPKKMGRSLFETSPSNPPLYDPAELDEDVELDQEKKRRILDAFYRLESFTHYELLGIAEEADKKAIKAAYYQVAPEFHPDKFFRKNLGTYKGKIEALFTRLTLAHDTLTNKQKREEYDEYLTQAKQNQAMQAVLEQRARDAATVHTALDQQARAQAGASVPPGRYSDAPRAPESPESIRARRETLARKLAGGQRVSSVPPQPRPPSDPSVTRAAGEALRARYEHALGEAKKAQLKRYLDLGKKSLEHKDYAGAANAYHIAASLAPEDPEVQKVAEEAQSQAHAQLADGYYKQAAFEVSLERWSEAAISYAKVVKGRPDDTRSHERLAHCLLKSGGNARRAVDAARRAVEQAPKNPEFRVTLARAYYAAGLEKSAEGELARAKELAPADARIKELIVQSKDIVKEYHQKAAKDAEKASASPAAKKG